MALLLRCINVTPAGYNQFIGNGCSFPMPGASIMQWTNDGNRRLSLIAGFMGPTWDPSGADRTHLGPTGPIWAHVGPLNFTVWDVYVKQWMWSIWPHAGQEFDISKIDFYTCPPINFCVDLFSEYWRLASINLYSISTRHTGVFQDWRSAFLLWRISHLIHFW